MQVSVMRKVGASSAFARCHKHLAGLDAKVYALTGGRLASASLGSGLRQLLITTTGRKSGQPRTVTLAYFDVADSSYAVIGSNYGQPHPAAWALNLIANPEATITIRGTTAKVTARVVEGDERAAIWSRSVETWPAYASYEQRASNRRIPVFILEPHK